MSTMEYTDSRGAESALDEPAAAALARMAELSPTDPVRIRLRDRLICAYLPFARRLARRYAGRGEATDDLEQVAALGLIKAVDRFDASLDTPFENFAGPTVAGEVKRHFRDKGWGIRVTRRTQELVLTVNRTERDLTQRLGRAVTPTEIADHLGRDEREIEAAEGAVRAYWTESLNAPVSVDGGKPYLEPSEYLIRPRPDGMDPVRLTPPLVELLDPSPAGVRRAVMEADSGRAAGRELRHAERRPGRPGAHCPSAVCSSMT